MPLADHIKKDSPTNKFATFDPLVPTGISLSNGNLTSNTNAHVSGALYPSKSTLAVPVGKFYWEAFYNPTTKDNPAWGVLNSIDLEPTGGAVTGDDEHVAYWPNNGNANTYYKNGSVISGVTGSNFTVGDIAMCCVEMAADGTGKIWFGSNGAWHNSGDPSNTSDNTYVAFSSKTVIPFFDCPAGHGALWVANFGQDHSFNVATSSLPAGAGSNTPDNGIGTFAYTVPTDAKALCTANLPDFTPNVDDDNPEDYFKCVGYVGNGTTGTAGQTVTTGFQPDLIWMKNRDESQSHALVDSVRTRDKVLFSDSTGAEQTSPAGKDVASIISTGFTVDEPDRAGSTNNSGSNIISWCWKAGGAPGGTNTATSGPMNNSSVSIDNVIQSNYTPSGTIYPKSISINTEQQFSITKYFGIATNDNATIGHGLNGTPDIVIIKSLGQSGTWQVYNSTIGAGRILGLNNSSERTAANDAYFMQTLPNATVVTLGYDGNGNEQNDDTHYIMYCWRSVEHFSAIKSYTGNGSSDGPFIYTGFRPAFLLVRGVYGTGSTSGNHWFIYDNQRPAYNEAYRLLADLGNSEDTSNQPIDLLSNGFKIRNSNYAMNYSGGTYIYMAFAEQPTKFANAR